MKLLPQNAIIGRLVIDKDVVGGDFSVSLFPILFSFCYDILTSLHFTYFALILRFINILIVENKNFLSILIGLSSGNPIKFNDW